MANTLTKANRRAGFRIECCSIHFLTNHLSNYDKFSKKFECIFQWQLFHSCLHEYNCLIVQKISAIFVGSKEGRQKEKTVWHSKAMFLPLPGQSYRGHKRLLCNLSVSQVVSPGHGFVPAVCLLWFDLFMLIRFIRE